MNDILLITNDTAIIATFEDNLVLLRESDSVSYCDYTDASEIVFSNNPDIVILHEYEDKEKTLNLIKYIKDKCKNIILLINKYDRDFVLSAYDEGIDDYFSVQSDPSEMLLRIINCIKKNNLKDEVRKYKGYLKEYGVIAESTGFISHKFSSEICKMELKNYADGALIVISPDEEGKANFSSEKLADAVNKSIRYGDLAANASGTKFYLLLANSGLNGAVTVFEKIKQELKNKFSIKAGICEITGSNFEETERRAQCALADAMINNQEMVIYADKNDTLDDWLDEPAKTSEQNFKLFKQAFNKKLEKVIAPVFYRLQKSYEEKLFNTKIEQYTDETQSVFCLKNPKQESRLKIVYPGFAKIIIYVTHAGLNSPENDEITLPINKITQKELVRIIEDFIKEFKTTII